MKRNKYIGALVAIALCLSCTKLKENLYSSLSSNTFYKNEQECILAMGNSYTKLQYQGTSLWGLMGTEMLSTDEGMCPVRTQGGFLDNNGIWIKMHTHEFLPTIDPIQSSWDFAFSTIASCNQVIYQIQNSPSEFAAKPNMIAELKVLRAYAYYKALDLYGNIPVVLDFTDVSLPKQTARADAFKVIEKELLDNLPLLDAGPTAENYGRCTRPMAYAVLAKMYLNSAKWIGTARWQDALTMCNNIITPGNYSLEPDYFANFAVNNTGSKENIFVLPYDRQVGWGLQMYQYTLHSSQAENYNYSSPLWNGLVVQPPFYNLYDASDKRINSWMVGQQYSPTGQALKTSMNTPLIFTTTVTSLTAAGEAEGARCQKWEFPKDLELYETMDNDWSLFRYADILLMKAEAIMRNNSGVATQDAVNAVNLVRERAYGNATHDYTTATLTLDELLNERGREMAFEGHRRQDLIRFGKWEGSWYGKPAEADAHTELYPIPSTALSANSNLQQNNGY